MKANFDRQKDPANKCRCAFYIAYIHDVQAPDELTVVYNLNDPAVNLPALMTIQSSNNVIQSPTAWKTKGDDYNRNPVGTGPYILKSWTAGDRMVLERNPDYWNKGHPYLDRIVLKPLPDAQSRFASLQSGEADIVWDDEYDADNIQKAQKDPKMTVHTYAGSGRRGLRLQHQGRAVRRCARAPGAGDGDRSQEDVAGDHQRLGPAGHQSLWRRLLGQVQGRRRAAQRCREGQGADQGLRQAGRFQDDRHRDAARPHVGQVLQQFWKQVGANMEIEQIDQATIVPRAFMRQFQLTPWRIVDLADPDPQMYANFHTGSPVALANYSNPELDKLLEHARTTADIDKRTEDYCAISRLINKEAIWFWTFQNTYYAISSARLKGLPKIYSGVIDVSDVWME